MTLQEAFLQVTLPVVAVMVLLNWLKGRQFKKVIATLDRIILKLDAIVLQLNGIILRTKEINEMLDKPLRPNGTSRHERN